MHPGLSLGYWLTLHGLVTFVAVLLYVMTAHVLRQPVAEGQSGMHRRDLNRCARQARSRSP